MSNKAKTFQLENVFHLGNKSKRWQAFSSWIHCICTVTFDLELGQALESIHPSHVTLTKQEISNICYLAFPDSNSSCMGDTSFTIRLQSGPSNNEPLELTQEHIAYNSKCWSVLQIDHAFYWGYVYFRQVKDATLPRGYFQKSVVILSRLPFNHLFGRMASFIAPEYFHNGSLSLEAACANIDQWPTPIPGVSVNLPLLGTVFQTYIPPHQDPRSSALLHNSANSTDTNCSLIQIQSVADLNLFDVFQPVLCHVDLLWELVITAEPLIVMACSPTHCSSMVLALSRIISPIKFCADHRPYFTIHDTEFKQFTSKLHGPPPVILGVTNPFFAKTLHHWPHTIRLGADMVPSSSRPSRPAPPPPSNQTAASVNVKSRTRASMFDPSPGLYTTYKPFLQKDKNFMKNLLSGVQTRRPSEVQSALIRKHLLELTHTFMIPLERYIASLMPLLKNISPFKAAPTPLPFNPDDFFATLENAGPQLTTGIKGDWCGLYRRFFRSPNFNGWFNARYTELALKLQALQLEALCEADFKLWVHGKPEVEIVDMVLKIKNKISKFKDLDTDLLVSGAIKEQLEKRLNDIIGSLPEDLKNILIS